MNLGIKQKALLALKEMKEEYGMTLAQIVDEGINKKVVGKLLAELTLGL
jgi:hypothetical protein